MACGCGTLWLVLDALPKPALDANSTEPLYRQLAGWLREGIATGRLKAGERLPATRELASYLGLNRATVSAAYALLDEDHLLSGHVGKGSFVRPVTTEPSQAIAANVGPFPSAAISFTTSRPSAALFPVDAFRQSCLDVLDSAHMAQILQLGAPQGYTPLRQYLMDEARRTGMAAAGDDVLVTSGCQQALDLVQRMLVADRPGPVAMEDPVYAGIRNVFPSPRVAVPVTIDGLNLAALERLLATERPRALVVTPSFQNPTGCSLGLAERRRVVELAQRARCLVIENDIYSDLRYAGQPEPALKQIDAEGNVLVLKSFSKAAFPGLRVGWIIGPKAMIARLTEIRQWCDLHTDQLSQAVLLRFAESGRLERHRQQMCAAGGLRLAAVLAACERHLPAGSRFSRPSGGMNLWVELPGGLDTASLLDEACRRGVSYLPGSVFAVQSAAPSALRLSFAGLEPSQIEEGLRILGRLFAERLAAGARTPFFEPETALV
jgi:DNA-binding transcriptional MocR family regulator